MANRHFIPGIVAVLAIAFTLELAADDWPTYRHDVRRSGVSSEAFDGDLSEDWVFTPAFPPSHAWGDPQPKAIEGNLELPRMRFDDAFHVVVSGDGAYFGSSSDNSVCALDVSTGEVRWKFHTLAPVRVAPSLWDGKVFAGSDDGKVYCLDAEDGRRVWTFSAAPTDDMMLGHGRMASAWPVRTSVAVDDGIAYFSAGLFPAEGLFLYALDAKTGEMLWKNDSYAKGGREDISPQGYIVVGPDKLFIPSGRSMPAAFSRRDGEYLFHRNFSWRGIGLFGGSYSMLSGKTLFNGTEQILAVDADSGALSFVAGPKSATSSHLQRMAVTEDTVFFADGARLSAYRKGPWAKARATLQRLDRDIIKVQDEVNYLSRRVRNDKSVAKRLGQRSAHLKKLKADRDSRREKLKDPEIWSVECTASEDVVLAGGMVFVGGDDIVMGMDTRTGKQLWSARVRGKARGIAIADGRVFVSTNSGSIHCFVRGDSGRGRKVSRPVDPQPYGDGELTQSYSDMAGKIVEATGIRRGFGLILGGTGQLALELAKRTDLLIYVVEPDAEKAAVAREAMDDAGLSGGRVIVMHSPADELRFSDYFANLIVCPGIGASGGVSTPPDELLRMLKPCGGVAYVGRQAGAPGGRSDGGAVRNWLKGLQRELDELGEDETSVDLSGGRAKITRGRLNNAGSWTHQYAEPGNTTCSDDRLVRGSIGMLWYGAPGPEHMPSRHAGNVSPLAFDGRMFVQGENIVMAYDAYNGVKLWERKLPGALRLNMKMDCSNFAADPEGVLVAIGDRCLRLDPATGETIRTFKTPEREGKPRRNWGYVASIDGLLLGSYTTGGFNADGIFAIDIESGETRWVYNGKQIMHSTICAGDGRVFFVDRSTTEAQTRQGIEGVAAEMRKDRRGRTVPPDVRLVVALETEDGEKAWKRPQYVSDCVKISRGGGDLTAMYSNNVLLLCGQPWNGHFWGEFFSGEFSRRSLIALAGDDGRELWSGRKGYRSRPLIVDDTIIAEPWAHDLSTGAQKMRRHPVTGADAAWQMSRPGHHCGCIAAAPGALFFRSGVTAYYDLEGDYGTAHFGAQRLGCWVNAVPANGLVLVPEASSGCVCPFSIHCTVVFQPRKTNRVWGMFSAPGPMTPVKHLAVNLGAPGDRRSSDDDIWLAYPRPRTDRLVLDMKLDTQFVGGGFDRRNPSFTRIEGTDDPWIYASCAKNLRRCKIPVVGPDDPPGEYSVKLFFAEDEDISAGHRVFDIKLQGRTVAEDFDILREAGRVDKACVRQFDNITVHGDIVLDLIPENSKPSDDQEPLLNGIEIIRTRVLPASITARPCILGDYRPAKTTEATIKNLSDENLTGVLKAAAPSGFKIEPAEQAVSIAAGKGSAVELRMSVSGDPEPGEYEATLKLVRNDRTESVKRVPVRYAGDRNEIVLHARADTHVRKVQPDENSGGLAFFYVDGGNQEMGDAHHGIGLLKFDLDVPGKPTGAKLRLRVSTHGHAQSSDSGVVHLLEKPWDENEVTYNNRPEPGKKIGTIGKIVKGELVERELDVDLEGRRTLSLALVPTSTDGSTFISREGGEAPSLVVTFGPIE